MDPSFLASFPPADKSAWLTQVQKESKSSQNGEDAYESLRWHTEEGFIQEPYYTADDLREAPLTTRLLDTIQSAQKSSPGWLNTPDWVVEDEKAANNALRQALSNGADALVLALTAETNWSAERLSRLLNGIKLSDTPVFFRLAPDDEHIVDFVRALKTVAPYQLRGGLLLPVGEWTAEATRLLADSPQFRTICVNSHAYHNAGATATQELAFTMAALTDAYDQLTDSGLSIGQVVGKTVLSVSVGTSYFPEIAKLRALRVLLGRLIQAYEPSSALHPSSVHVHCQTSTFYDARATPNTNLLRATTEAMAAVIGGCDALTVHPHDTVVGLSADFDFSARIARNISVLLKEESYFDKVADPSAGSYYIEVLTAKLIERAWALFLTVEEQGGYARALANGFITAELDRAYQAKVDAVQQGKVLVGVTKFRFDEPGAATHIPAEQSVDVAPKSQIPTRRLAESFD